MQAQLGWKGPAPLCATAEGLWGDVTVEDVTVEDVTIPRPGNEAGVAPALSASRSLPSACRSLQISGHGEGEEGAARDAGW